MNEKKVSELMAASREKPVRIYIANLGKYNEGELVGTWFGLPADEDEIAEALEAIDLGPDSEYEEYAIHDYECDDIPQWRIHEFDSIEHINSIAESIESIDKDKDTIDAYLCAIGGDIEDAISYIKDGDVWFHPDMTLEDLAEEFVDEGVFGDIPDNLANYIDYAAIARDLDCDGGYYEVNGGVLECR